MLVGFDRLSGKLLWKIPAKHSFWNNGVIAGGGRIYCLDRYPKQVEEKLQRAELQPRKPIESLRLIRKPVEKSGRRTIMSSVPGWGIPSSMTCCCRPGQPPVIDCPVNRIAA